MSPPQDGRETSGEILRLQSGSAAGQVSLTRHDAIGVIAFSRSPENFFDLPLLQRLADAFEAADGDGDIRAMVLRSDGRNFCAGADLVKDSLDPVKLYEQAERLFAVRKPSVAAIQGTAVGGGLGLALAVDFRVVTASTRMSANFVKLGMHPGFAITHTLPRLVGHQKAAELLLTGRRVNGEEALSVGLADRLVGEDVLQSAALAFAGEIADAAPLAVEATRETLRIDLLSEIRRHTALEATAQLRLRSTEDFAEGVRAVAERRPGDWKRR